MENNFEKIYLEARKAGLEAVTKLQVRPMIVQEHTNMLDDNSPVAHEWLVEDGVCGFAWISIRPTSKSGRNDCDFVRWLRANRIGSYDDYTKSWHIWIGEFNQSMQKKETYADAVSDILRKYGIQAHSASRMD